MDNQQFPKEQTDLLQAVYDMRRAQADYFHQPNKFRLQKAKNLEVKVDAILQPYVKASAIKPTVQAAHQVQQPQMFE